MAPLASQLVGFLSMFLQLGVLALLTVLAMLVRTSLGRRKYDFWTLGLALNTAALAILALFAVGNSAGRLPALPVISIVYAALEDAGALAFIAALRRRRAADAFPPALVAAALAAVAAVTVATFRAGAFFDVYRIHATTLALLLGYAAFEGLRAPSRGLGTRLTTVALAALALDYGHFPLLAMLGVHFEPTYLGLESYVTVVFDVALGVAIVVHTTDGARAELERRNEALAEAQRALRNAAYTDALCGVPNRMAFLERIANPPRLGTVAMIDLDGLKAINDQFGHAAGDLALEVVARSLRDHCGQRGTVYRVGGDEFAAIWEHCDPESARAMLGAAEKDLAILEVDTVAPARISWGVARFDADTPFMDALVAADVQLYDGRGARREDLPGIATSAIMAERTQIAADASITPRNPAR